MADNHVRILLEENSPYVGRTCPIRRSVKFHPGQEVALCQVKDIAVSSDTWPEFTRTGEGKCIFCGLFANAELPLVRQVVEVAPPVPPYESGTRPTTREPVTPPRPIRPTQSPVTQRGGNLSATTPYLPPSTSSIPRSSDGISITRRLATIITIALICGFVAALFFLFDVSNVDEAVAISQPPQSFFVAHQRTLWVDDEQVVPIATYHIGKERLTVLEVFINNQPVAEFPAELATVQVLLDGQPVQTNPIEPVFPTRNWEVAIVWMGHTPGTYDLSLVVTDEAGRKGEPVVQRIEVR